MLARLLGAVLGMTRDDWQFQLAHLGISRECLACLHVKFVVTPAFVDALGVTLDDLDVPS